ncbi:hypothetical protein [Xanthomonas rydalmerensis]|uniref:Uncharacterized protein n=1 Tax=Xanthomonas rydalmerensis TaxID=3046274 RepID=A0ABZ0JM56_9XANT|nr:hypothetical protein [Xanthomonas sp. DM-2023]WOS40862.1 hypothetical protein QN243_21175 [Xanthomonas sp. DM-2023]WOS45047.1 hypothetical protein QN242_21175 [Xanthomonas sp. DM-2023]WOS49226.1 hypothetical protein QN240_21175 [Xanthomonas sp. DM-2023]WOS53406.1 hypothetical protein QN244_21180 [Xanthomonas sp. DM-2023]WOS57589.1 hypothetical protein QN245_21175 [Xanthomonas sp. DM-2023]
MKVDWRRFISALGHRASSREVSGLLDEINEMPVVSSDPDDNGDPSFGTQYYQFFRHGLEFGFRSNALSFIHFFIKDQDGFFAYKGKIFEVSGESLNESLIFVKFGPPKDFGGGKYDVLLGYIQRWIKYNINEHEVRFEILPDGGVWKVTLIA